MAPMYKVLLAVFINLTNLWLDYLISTTLDSA